MRSITHAICAVAATSILLGFDPALLVTGALASQLPDVDSFGDAQWSLSLAEVSSRQKSKNQA